MEEKNDESKTAKKRRHDSLRQRAAFPEQTVSGVPGAQTAPEDYSRFRMALAA